MKKNISSMSIVINKNKKKVLILNNEGEWVFSKGHVKDKENFIDTAIRELKEESGVLLSNSNCLGQIDEFEFYHDLEDVIKIIKVFLFEIDDLPLIKYNKEEGFIDGKWVDIEKGLSMLSHMDAKNAFIKGLKKINCYIEYRDLYDENRNKIGEKIKKGDIIPKGKYYITVVIIIENLKGEFLLQVNNKYNMWSFTGGHPKMGENSKEGIISEVYEELGVNIEKENFYLFDTIKSNDDFVDLYYLKKDIDISSIKIDTEEVENVRWFSILEIKKLIKDNKILPAHIEFFKRFLALLKNKNL